MQLLRESKIGMCNKLSEMNMVKDGLKKCITDSKVCSFPK